MRSTVCATAFLAFWCSTALALAEESKPVPCDLGRNAALTYWRAFAMFPEMTKDEENIVSRVPELAPMSTPEQRADLAKRWGASLQLMREAADIPQCDWGVNYEKEGPGEMLPQLAKARALARAAAFRARYFWEIGQRKEAAEDLRSAVILARQVGNEGRDTLTAVLVQIAMESIVDRTTALLLTDRESADVLSKGLGDLVNGSPARLASNAILAEKKAFIPWFRREFSANPVETKSSKDLPPELRGYPVKDVPQALDELEKQYDKITALFRLPFREYLANRSALEEEIKASKNPFSTGILPALTRIRDEEERYRIRWAMVRAAIEIRREGESALSKVSDPSDGKPFQYTALEGGAFELKSALRVEGSQEIVMTFGRAPAKKD